MAANQLLLIPEPDPPWMAGMHRLMSKRRDLYGWQLWVWYEDAQGQAWRVWNPYREER